MKLFLASALKTCVIAAGLLTLGPAAPAQSNQPPAPPSFRYYGVVLSAENLKYRPHDDVIYPSVLRVDKHLSKPAARYFMYYAPHDAPGGICLALADQPEGPWREFEDNPVITASWPPHHTVSHVSGPDAIWNAEEKKIFVYYHGENDVTRWATSEDGIRFQYGGVAVTSRMFDRVSEASYGRVFARRQAGKPTGYRMLLMGNQQGTRRIFLASSQDARAWQARPTPLVDPPPGTDQVAGAIYLARGNRHYLIFHANNSKLAFNQGYDLYVAETDEALSNVRHAGKFLSRTFVSPDNPAVMSPCLLEDEGRLVLYFNIGPRLKNKIALALEAR